MVIIWATQQYGASLLSNFILREDGGYMLREDGSKFIREQ